MIKFNFNKEKAKQVILYLSCKRKFIDKMSLYKFMFFSDEIHINKFGRPIFGGKYVAMPLGPVPSEVKTLLERPNEEFDIKDYWITPCTEPNYNYLSESDIEALDLAYGKYSNYTPQELSDISHKHKAWINARKSNKFLNNNAIDYRDLIESCNIDLIEDLEENSELIAI